MAPQMIHLHKIMITTHKTMLHVFGMFINNTTSKCTNLRLIRLHVCISTWQVTIADMKLVLKSAALVRLKCLYKKLVTNILEVKK